MKKLVLLLFLLPVVAVSQYDFETRYFTIDASSLPEVDDLVSISLFKTPTPLNYKVPDFKVNENNYRTPVDMMTAISEKERFFNRKQEYDVSAIQSQYAGIGGTKVLSDGKTTVTNTVYKEARGLQLVDPCPPVGICPRCAPYRIRRGY